MQVCLLEESKMTQLESGGKVHLNRNISFVREVCYHIIRLLFNHLGQNTFLKKNSANEQNDEGMCFMPHIKTKGSGRRALFCSSLPSSRCYKGA